MEPDRAAGFGNFRPHRTPVAITSTGFYYFDVWILAQAARILGKTADYNRYAALAFSSGPTGHGGEWCVFPS